MTFLAPALLALGLAAAVPLVLHLLQRHQGPRVVFPALRYLRRAEREHASRIRLRQLLLLALRVLAVLLLAAAAARPFIRGAGSGHPPTSVVLVLDNSLSSGAVVGDRRVLDDLREAALETLETAGADDRFWLIRAGAPWEPAVAGDAGAIAGAIRETEPSAGAARLPAAVARARSILAQEPEARPVEIHLLSDLQATGLEEGASDDAAAEAPGTARRIPLVALTLDEPAPRNRAVAGVEIGGGLPPLAGERSVVAVTASDRGEDGAPADSTPVRLTVEGAVRAAGWLRPGSTTLLPFPARPAGRAAGSVELDPDALRADDRRWFVVDVAPATAVALAPSAPFLEEAVDVLEEAGRVRRAPLETASVVLAPAARSADEVRRGATVVVLPPASPLRMAAANQRLAGAGIPWRYSAPGPGEARLDTGGSPLARSLGDVRLRQVYGLAGESGSAGDSVALRLQDGDPWAVLGEAVGGGRYALLASPLTLEGGTLAISAAMVPFLDRVLTGWARGGEAAAPLEPGALVTVSGDSVIGPDGAERIGAGTVYRLRSPGVYRVLAAGDTVAAYAVNPPAAESRLGRASPGRLGALLPGVDVTTARADEWREEVYRDRLGREVTFWLLLAALLILALEMALSASGRGRRRTPEAGAGLVPAGAAPADGSGG